jgi:hypothetical protein
MTQLFSLEPISLHDTASGFVILPPATDRLSIRFLDTSLQLTLGEFQILCDLICQDEQLSALYHAFASRKSLFGKSGLRPFLLSLQTKELKEFQQLVIETSLMLQVYSLLSEPIH